MSCGTESSCCSTKRAAAWAAEMTRGQGVATTATPAAAWAGEAPAVAWAGMMARGQGPSAVGGGEDLSITHRCDGCANGEPCPNCGGNISRTHPAYQALEWGAMQAERFQSPFWQAATVAHVVEDAPGLTEEVNWGFMDLVLRALSIATSSNILPEFGLAQRSAASGLSSPKKHAHTTSGGGGQLPDSGTPPEPRNDTLNAVASTDYSAKSGVVYSCCCVAVSVNVTEPITSRPTSPFQWSSWYHVTVTVQARPSKKRKKCELIWEENNTFGYSIRGGSAGSTAVPTNVWADLSEHAYFTGVIAKSALEDLDNPCFSGTTQAFHDTPGTAKGQRQRVRVRLKSGCDESEATAGDKREAEANIDNVFGERPRVLGPLQGSDLEDYGRAEHVKVK